MNLDSKFEGTGRGMICTGVDIDKMPLKQTDGSFKVEDGETTPEAL
jgi:hypothetical protein